MALGLPFCHLCHCGAFGRNPLAHEKDVTVPGLEKHCTHGGEQTASEQANQTATSAWFVPNYGSLVGWRDLGFLPVSNLSDSIVAECWR